MRQVEHFDDDFDLTVICFEEIQRPGHEVSWNFVDKGSSLPRKLLDRGLIAGGAFWHGLYDYWLQTRPRYQKALRLALETDADIYQANDWAALAIAVEAAKVQHAKVVFDAHEYWALESENRRWWRMFVSPLIQHTIERLLLHRRLHHGFAADCRTVSE